MEKQRGILTEVLGVLGVDEQELQKELREGQPSVRDILATKLTSLFQDLNKTVFDIAQINKLKGLPAGEDPAQDFIQHVYRPRVEAFIAEVDDGALVDDFEDNLSSEEFSTFLRTVFGLTLHMVLSDPEITLEL